MTKLREVVGYVVSRSTPHRVHFVIKKGERVELGKFYGVNHPFWGDEGPMVLLRVFEILSMNEEMDLGRTGVLASSAGLVPSYQGELEYLVASSEVLGYRDPINGGMRSLEFPPSTTSQVCRPSQQDLSEFFSSPTSSGLRLKVGTVKDSGVDFHLDLDALARGHAFIAGMTRSGKSVAGDEVTALYDAKERRLKICPIGEFVDGLVVGRSGSVKLGNRYLALSLHRRDLIPTWSLVHAVHRHSATGEMYEVETETRRRLRVTGDHSLLVFDGFDVVEMTPERMMRERDYWLLTPNQSFGPIERADGEKAELIASALSDGYNIGTDVVIYGDVEQLTNRASTSGMPFYSNHRFASMRDEGLVNDLINGFGSMVCLPPEQRKSALKEFLRRSSVRVDERTRFVFVGGALMKRITALFSLMGLRVLAMGRDWLKVDEESVSRATCLLARDGAEATLTFRPEMGDLIRRERLRKGICRHKLANAARLSPMRLRSIEGGTMPTEGELGSIFSALESERALKVLTSPKLSLEKVVSVKKIGRPEEFVYDLSVEGTENFIAGGVFVHNSTFAINLIKESQKLRPRPRFLVLDRRGEYSSLTESEAVCFDYRAFLPREGALRPEDVARRLGINRGTLRKLVEIASQEAISKGDLNPDALTSGVRKLAISMELRDRRRLIKELSLKLKHSGDLLRPKGEGLSIIDTIQKFPTVVVDFSIDADYDDQFLALRRMTGDTLRHAILRKAAGDFALIVVVEEAQYIVPERTAPIVGDPFGSGLSSVMTEAISQSGGYNVGFLVMSQRPAYVSKNVISQSNTVICFRLKNGNDQEAITTYTEGDEAVRNYLPTLENHEAMIWGMASRIPFPVAVRTVSNVFPSKATASPSQAWERMEGV